MQARSNKDFLQVSLSGDCFANTQSHIYAALDGRVRKKAKVMSPSHHLIVITDNRREISPIESTHEETRMISKQNLFYYGIICIYLSKGLCAYGVILSRKHAWH
jgi:hypothetical protein